MITSEITHRQTRAFKVSRTGRYVIQVSASLAPGSAMWLEIDNLEFREIPPTNYVSRYNHAAAWNGALLKGKNQTNYYILDLPAGLHTLVFYSKGQVRQLKVDYLLVTNPQQLLFAPEIGADNRERQPFVNFILVNLPLAQVEVEATLTWHTKNKTRGDGDDLKVIADGQICRDDDRYDWLLHANPRLANLKKKVSAQVYPALPSGIHYLELWADRSPILHRVLLNLQPIFSGDYWCQAKNININRGRPQLSPSYHPALGIYVPSGDPQELSSANTAIYFNSRQLPTQDQPRQSKIESSFNWGRPIFQENNWFFYEINPNWRVFEATTGGATWQDTRFWQVKKR